MKRILILFSSVILAITVEASPVCRQEATTLAASFLKQASLETVEVPFENLYVFNGDHSFVIVPADDVVTPIIGYSHDGCFSVEHLGINALGWLMTIDENIRSAREVGKQASDQVHEQWNSLRNGFGLPAVNRNEVRLMVMTHWSQGSPYNNYCPEGCVTGCAATAMAQVMKYWEFPNHGTGSYTYDHPVYGTLSADFGATTYDWDNMTNTYNDASTESERDAVATLMYHCGVSMDMNYAPDGSGGHMWKMATIVSDYFGYAPTAFYAMESNYTDAAWKSLLKSDLDALRPVCYAGWSGSGFHAFVCDGYDEADCFHFNWGWGGANDGYYAIGDLISPEQTYTNYAVFGVSPIYTVDAPTDLMAEAGHGQVQLTWTKPQGTVSFNVYRDEELVAKGVTQAYYCDTEVSYGTHSYYVKAFNGNGDRSWKSNQADVIVEFTAPTPSALGVTMAGDSLTLHWDMPNLLHDTLAYGTGPYLTSYGYGPTYPNPTFWGQRFPAEMLKTYGGYYINGVSLYVTVLGSYTLNVCRGNDRGVTEVMARQTFEVGETGWVDMLLDTPYPLEITNDVWIVMNTPGGMYWVSAVCEYDGPGLEDAAFYAIEMSDHFISHGMGHSYMMKTLIEDGLTYRVTRNGSLVGSGLHDRSFVDCSVTSGEWTYKVWSSYQGVECDEPAIYTVSLAMVETTVSDLETGTVEGGGLYEVGSTATLEAVAEDGFTFVGWQEDGVEVSTDNPYSFVVDAPRQLVAVFAQKYYTINATATLGGAITPSGEVMVERGEDVTFAMTPNQGCSVLQVIVDGEDVGSVQSYTFNGVLEDHTIHVEFKGYGMGEDVAEVRIAPNPVKDELHVESTTFIRRLEIAMLNGAVVENKRVDGFSVDCHLGGLAEGAYLLRLFTEEGVITKKILVSE